MVFVGGTHKRRFFEGQIRMKWYDLKRKLAYNLLAWRDLFDTYIAKSLPVVETPLGFSMTGGNSQHHKAMQKGTFEPMEVQWLKRELQSAQVFVDIGANIGYFSCFARALGKQVLAVEPMPSNLNSLLHNIEINTGSPVEVYPVALSTEVGVLRLYGASSTGASLVPLWAGASTRISRLVPVTTLDNLLSNRFSEHRLLIKMDVEGAEYGVLLGALETLQRVNRPMWLVEITMGQFMPQGVNDSFMATFELFLSRGYQCQLLTNNELVHLSRDVLQKWHDQGYSDYAEINYVFS
jgi:FkbM family methyltransferase